jgi:hypothetical protein
VFDQHRADRPEITGLADVRRDTRRPPAYINVNCRSGGINVGSELSSNMTESGMTISEPQRLRALGRANEIRLARAGLKRRIAIGEVSAAEVILTCPDAATSWSVGDLLASQRRWGSTRCRKFLSRNQIVETKPIGQLTERQRRVLAAALGSAAEVREMELVGA